MKEKWSYNDNKILRDFSPRRHTKKQDVFHSNVYAAAGSGENIGASSGGISVAKRKAIEDQRKFVRGYNNSRIMDTVYKAKKISGMVPRTAGGRGSLVDKNADGMLNSNKNDAGTYGTSTYAAGSKKDLGFTDGGLRFNRGGDDKGNVRTNYGRTAGLPKNRPATPPMTRVRPITLRPH